MELFYVNQDKYWLRGSIHHTVLQFFWCRNVTMINSGTEAISGSTLRGIPKIVFSLFICWGWNLLL